MSFLINLYKNTSPSIKVDKDLEMVVGVTGTLRDGVSILDPVITIQSNEPAAIVTQANYAYIVDLGRYYYITNIDTEINGLWTISFHVDVLMTYKDEIRQQSAVIARQASKYNLYLDDGWFMAYQNPRHQLKVFSVENPFETQEFVLVVAGS